MNTYFTFSIKQIYLVLFLVCGLSITAQKETKLPKYLGESSRNTLNNIQNNMDNHRDDKGFNPVENVIGVASNNYRIINHNGLEEANTIENLLAVPAEELIEIDNQINNELYENPLVVLNEQEIEFWSVFRRMINLPYREIHIGKTYGDPHIQTFDGYKYSFQTVGEYTLCTNKKGNFEIQTRQQATGPSVSLNTATAMNVNGDTVCIYSKNHPDAFTNEPIRVNGSVFEMKNSTSLLKKGGVIKIVGKKITILWPTGEEVMVKLANNSLNVVPKVYTSNNGEYFGLLGNANGNPADDLITYGGNFFKPRAAFYELNDITSDSKIKKRVIKSEKNYKAELIKIFGDSWRITNHNSLFLYKPYENTLTYTNYFFPAEQFSLAEADKDEVRKAKKECQKAGVAGDEMEGCISDIITTKDISFANEAALLSDNEEIFERTFNSNNKMRKLPTLEEARKIEQETIEIARKKEREENRVTVGDIIRTVTNDDSSSDEKPAIRLPERENNSNNSLPSAQKPSSSPSSTTTSKPSKNKKGK